MSTIEKEFTDALHKQFPGKRFKFVLKKNGKFTVQWSDKKLPSIKVKRIVSGKWKELFGESVIFGKIYETK